MERLTLDPLLTVLVGVCLVLAIVGWRRRARWATLGTAVAVTAGLHVTLAQVGWYERYQIYLIGLALLALAWAGRDLPASVRVDRPHLVPLLVLVLLLTTTTKISLTVEAPRGVADTYEQRYQAARFLSRYYDGEPVATGELGYISLFHEGPITDFYGLGDHEVLVARREIQDEAERAAYWDELVQRRGVAVAAIYPTNLLFEVPERWILVGTWTLPARAVHGLRRALPVLRHPARGGRPPHRPPGGVRRRAPRRGHVRDQRPGRLPRRRPARRRRLDPRG